MRMLPALIDLVQTWDSLTDQITGFRQWGNLLTLAAAFKDPQLNKYIEEATLRTLFERTIAFFKVIAQPSSALWSDMRILQGLDRELWSRGGSNAEMMDIGSSFSSNASGPPPQPPLTPSAAAHHDGLPPVTPIDGPLPSLPPVTASHYNL